MEEFLRDWGYLGIFLGLIATGVGFPMPEELPVVIGGGLASSHDDIRWYVMLLVCIAGVIVGDGFLYGIGRLWGPKLLQYGWIKRRVFPPERLAKIEHNFHEYGVKLLLFARLTPGVRAPVFFTAGLTRLPLAKFLLADGLYAIPGVSFLFFLGYWFTESMIAFVKGPFEQAKSIIIIVVIVAVVGYLLYRVMRKPAVTGDPKEMPPLVEQVTHTLEHTLEQVTSKLRRPRGSAADTHKMDHPPTDGQAAAPPQTPVGEAGAGKPAEPRS